MVEITDASLRSNCCCVSCGGTNRLKVITFTDDDTDKVKKVRLCWYCMYELQEQIVNEL